MKNILTEVFNMKNKKKVSAGKITEKDFMKANRIGSRNAEIEMYGKPINYTHTFRNKKKYTRKEKHKGTTQVVPFSLSHDTSFEVHEHV